MATFEWRDASLWEEEIALPITTSGYALSGLFNFRDLGGLPVTGGRSVACGLVYRSDALRGATEADRKVLVEQLHIRDLVDLRTAEEAGGDGREDERIFPGSRVHHLSILPEGRIGREPFPSHDPGQLAARYLVNLEEGSATVTRVFDVLISGAEAGRPTLFHCAAGRDRTGLVAALLLDALGTPRSEIARDYVASNHNARQVSARLRESPLYRNPRQAHTVELLQAQTICNFLELLHARYGGAAGWLERAGISVRRLSALVTPRASRGRR